MDTYRETTRRFGLLHLTITANAEGVELDFGPVPHSRRHIAPHEIGHAAIATYQARRYGGWHLGVRTAPGGNAVYRLRGDAGVELTLTDGRHVFIGTEDPKRLHAAILAATDAA